MQTAVITIGRNVGNTPMSLEDWNEFVERVRDQTSEHLDLWVSSAYKGSWGGVQEDAAIFYGAVQGNANLPKLRSALGTLAAYYQQDAIGLTVGEGELVPGFQVAEVTR